MNTCEKIKYEVGTILKVIPSSYIKGVKTTTAEYVIVISNTKNWTPQVVRYDIKTGGMGNISYYKNMHWSSKEKCWRVYNCNTIIPTL